VTLTLLANRLMDAAQSAQSAVAALTDLRGVIEPSQPQRHEYETRILENITRLRATVAAVAPTRSPSLEAELAAQTEVAEHLLENMMDRLQRTSRVAQSREHAVVVFAQLLDHVETVQISLNHLTPIREFASTYLS